MNIDKQRHLLEPQGVTSPGVDYGAIAMTAPMTVDEGASSAHMERTESFQKVFRRMSEGLAPAKPVSRRLSSAEDIISWREQSHTSFCGDCVLNLCVCLWMAISCCCAAVPAALWNLCCCFKICKCNYVNLDDVLDQMDTGDLVLFAGTRHLKWAQCSHWSHVGMVFIKREEDGSETKYLFEANHNDTYDGSCLVDLRKKIKKYKSGHTDVCWRALPKGTMTPQLRDKFDTAVLETFSSVPFDHDVMRGVKAIVDCCSCCGCCDTDEPDYGQTQMHAMFCSELIAAVYQTVGLMPRPPNGPPPCEFVPRDFAEDPGWNRERSVVKDMKFAQAQWFARKSRWCLLNDWCVCCPCGGCLYGEGGEKGRDCWEDYFDWF